MILYVVPNGTRHYFQLISTNILSLGDKILLPLELKRWLFTIPMIYKSFYCLKMMRTPMNTNVCKVKSLFF